MRNPPSPLWKRGDESEERGNRAEEVIALPLFKGGMRGIDLPGIARRGVRQYSRISPQMFTDERRVKGFILVERQTPAGRVEGFRASA